MSLVLLCNPKKLKKRMGKYSIRECFYKSNNEGNVLGFTEEEQEIFIRQLEQHLTQLWYLSEDYIIIENKIKFTGQRIMNEIKNHISIEDENYYNEIGIVWHNMVVDIDGKRKTIKVLKSYCDNREMRMALERYLMENFFKHIDYIYNYKEECN